MSRWNLPLPLLALLVITVAGIASFAIISSIGSAVFLVHNGNLAAPPFGYQYSMKADSVTPAFQAAGMHVGDEVLALDGEPVHGSVAIRQIMARHLVGDPLTVTVLRNGQTLNFTAPVGDYLQRDTSTTQSAGHPLHTILLNFVIQAAFPLICAIIAIWVLVSRPRDSGAWWVAGILQFMSTFIGGGSIWTGPVPAFNETWSQISNGYLTLSCVMLGLTFPVRSSMDVKYPWLRWVFIYPLIVTTTADVLETLVRSYHAAALANVSLRVYNVLDTFERFEMIAAVSLMCACVFRSYFEAKSQDARRRLRVLLLGTQLGLWPIFICVLLRFARHTSNTSDAVPTWFFYFSLAMLPLFPLSLAYSIVVERAMDVRILVRQGTQYALARGSLWGIQAALGAGVCMVILDAANKHSRSPMAKAAALALLLLFFAVRFAARKRASQWIDRRFFREQYSTDQVLSELSTEAGRFTEIAPLLETVTRRIGDVLHVNGMAVLLRQGNSFRLQLADGIALPESFVLPESSRSVSELEQVHRPATVYFDRPDEWLIEASDAERAALRELHAEVLLPLPGRQQLMGVMALGPKRSEQPYTKTDLQLLTSVAAQAGLAMENSLLISSLAQEAAQRERINREIEIAREVQQRLFPQSFPTIAGVDIAADCRPALAVGGDYYDCIVRHNGVLREAGFAPGAEVHATETARGDGTRLGIAIGDVSGKGISAALLMASLRASLRGQTLAGQTDLAEMMCIINQLLYEASDLNRYATFFFAEYEVNSRVLTYVNAGHNAPALLRRDNGAWSIQRLEDGGPVVGLIPAAAYVQQSLRLQQGDMLVAYTDGISEAMNPADEEWGEDALFLDAQKHASLPAAELLKHLFRSADTFADGAPQHDDMTLVILRVT